MTCPNCGYDAPGKFCTMCGTRVAGEAPRASASAYGAVWPGNLSTADPVPGVTGEDDGPVTTAVLHADLEEFAARATSEHVTLQRPLRHPGAAGDAAIPTAPPRVLAPAASEIERTHATQHFRIHYAEASFAEGSMPVVSGRLENAYAAATALLALPSAAGSIDVYLSDVVSTGLDEPLVRGGYAVPDRLEIYEVYRSDAPGESLERSVLLVLLGLATEGGRIRSPLILDGVHARVMQLVGGFPPDEQVGPALANAKKQNDLPALTALFTGPTPETQGVYYLAAAGFVGFLMQTYGVDRLLAFLRTLDTAGPESAAQEVYGRKLSQLDRAWRKTLRAPKPRGVLDFIRLSSGYLQPYRLKVVEIIVYLSLSVAFGIGMAKLQGTLLDKALIPGDRHALAVIMGVLVGAFIVVSLTSLRQSYLAAYVSESVVREMRLRIFSLVQHLHPGYFQTVETGDIMSRMTSDVASIEFALTGAMLQGLRLLLMFVAALITIFFTNWRLALIAMAGTPFFFLTGRYFGPAAARASKARQENLAEVTSALQEDLAAQPVVKAFGLQERMIESFNRDLDRVFRSSLRLTYLSGLFGLSSNSIASAIQLTVLGVGAWLAIGHQLTTGTLFAFLALMTQIIAPIQSISGIMQMLQQASGSMDRVDELLKAEPAIHDVPDARTLEPLSRSIRLESVSFAYTSNQPTLRDLSLEIPAGARVALVGPSGCGKSTILNLIMRFYDPVNGRVTFDGVDLREATLESIHEQMGVVFQDNVLFNISIRENIRLGRLGATDAEVEAAGRAAELEELIAGMPNGYDTVVGERGSRLSGGQRQRVAIARAIIRNPSILLLDEATSALDPRTEAAINETLDRLGRGRTTIAVTHRLSSVVNADLIYVLEHGRLVEQGRHVELLRKGGLYAQLWREQGGSLAEADVPEIEEMPGVEVRRLRGVPLFARLDLPLLTAVGRQVSGEHFDAGDMVIRKGAPGDKLYIIEKGEVEVFASNATALQGPLAVLRDGDYFGEIALLYDVPRTAAIRARTDVDVYTLSKADFQGLLAHVPSLAAEVVQRSKSRIERNRLGMSR